MDKFSGQQIDAGRQRQLFYSFLETIGVIVLLNSRAIVVPIVDFR